MDNETNPSENDAEVVESSVKINENGCDEQTDDTDAVTESEEKDEPDAEAVSENKTEEDEKDGGAEAEAEVEADAEAEAEAEVDGDEDKECQSTKESPVDEPPSESDQFAVIDSDPSECSPEKGACIVSSPSEAERDELGNGKRWNRLENESSPEKSRSEVACVISSPSEADESANDKSWGQLNESVSEGNEDEDIDYDAYSADEIDYRSSQECIQYEVKQREKDRKVAADCQVFELTDDNSSGDDEQSDNDIDEMGEEEEDSGE